MGLLFKLILYTLLFCFVVYVIKMIARLGHSLRATITDVSKLREVMQTGKPPVSAEMVRCANCGSFTARNAMITLSSGQQKELYCSRECIAVKAAR